MSFFATHKRAGAGAASKRFFSIPSDVDASSGPGVIEVESMKISAKMHISVI